MQVHFSTAELPVRRRYSAWRDVIGTPNPPLISTPLVAERPDGEAPFEGGITFSSCGPVTVVEHAAEEVRFVRSAEAARRACVDAYYLFLQLEGAWHFEQDDRQQTVAAGDLLLTDPNKPFRSQKCGRWRHRVLRLPRAAMESWIVPGRGTVGSSCSGASGFGRTIALYARGVAEEIEKLTPEEGLAALRHLCQLFALGAAARPGDVEGGRDAWQAARLARIRRYVEQHLAAPDLTPARIAATAGISLRSLHLLFESTGTSIAQIITQKRLERCHAALVANPAARIADIAFAAGFNDLSTFQRAFKRAYGRTPRELREVAKTSAGGANAADP